MKQGYTLVRPLNLTENCPLLPEGLFLIAKEQAHSNVVQEMKALGWGEHFYGIISLNCYFIVQNISCLKVKNLCKSNVILLSFNPSLIVK